MIGDPDSVRLRAPKITGGPQEHNKQASVTMTESQIQARAANGLQSLIPRNQMRVLYCFNLPDLGEDKWMLNSHKMPSRATIKRDARIPKGEHQTKTNNIESFIIPNKPISRSFNFEILPAVKIRVIDLDSCSIQRRLRPTSYSALGLKHVGMSLREHTDLDLH